MRSFAYQRKLSVKRLILLVEDKGGKTQYLVEEISLFYYPGDINANVQHGSHLKYKEGSNLKYSRAEWCGLDADIVPPCPYF